MRDPHDLADLSSLCTQTNGNNEYKRNAPSLKLG